MENPFTDLARQFVLSDASSERQGHAQTASTLLQSSASSTQAFNNWITATGEWIQAGDDESQISRSRAYDFLALTLEGLPVGFLQVPRQVGLLVAFFVSVYRIDVRGGVEPATRALVRLSKEPNFKPENGIQILEGIPQLGDNFKLQDTQTRGVIFKLILELITRPDIVNEVGFRFGENTSFMTELLKTVQVERDALCLMDWLDILKQFLSLYTPAQEVTKEIFELFSSSYFPISLKTARHPSGITTADLKLALRACFASHHRVAEFAFPFLLGRLNGGDVAKVDIKLDILNTLTACVLHYQRVDLGIVPYVDEIWTNLKYEVRNGEVEETMAATLEVLRTVAQRLTETDLIRYCATVQHDCLEDLGNPNYTAQAGKLLLSALSAKPESFAITVSPIMNSIKDQLRHTKSPQHTAKLLSLSNSIIEIRKELLKTPEMRPEDAEAFRLTIPSLISLIEPYKRIFAGINPDADKETLAAGQEAVKGLASLAIQHAMDEKNIVGFILDAETIAQLVDEITDTYIAIMQPENHLSGGLLAVTSQLTQALQICADTHVSALIAVNTRVFSAVGELWHRKVQGKVEAVGTMLRDLAVISTSRQQGQIYSVHHYALFLSRLLDSFKNALNRYQPDIWRCHVVAAREAVLYITSAWEESTKIPVRPKLEPLEIAQFPSDPRFSWNEWVPYIRKRYEFLPTVEDDSMVTFDEDTGMEDENPSTREPGNFESSSDYVSQCLADIHLLSLYAVREMYRSATRVVPEQAARAATTNTRYVAIDLNPMFTLAKPNGENRYLVALSEYAKTVISQLHIRYQTDLFLADEAITLFRGNDVVGVDSFNVTKKVAHVTRVNGMQVRDGLIFPPDQRLQDMLTEQRKNLRCPPLFPMSSLSKGRTLILSYGVFAALQSYHTAGTAKGFDGAFEPWRSNYIAHRLLIAGLLGHEHPEDPVIEGYLFAMLASLGNKFQVEHMTVLDRMIPTYFKLLVDPIMNHYGKGDERYAFLQRDLHETDNTINKAGRVEVARRSLAVVAGMLRRLKNLNELGEDMQNAMNYIEIAPKEPNIGHQLARAMEVLFSENDALNPKWNSRVFGLWLQRSYSQFVDAWITDGLPNAGSVEDKKSATNYTIAALGALVNMPFAIWEFRVEDITRMCICVVKELPMGPDLERALKLLKIIHEESHEAMVPFIRSIVNGCLEVLKIDGDRTMPDWLPEDFVTRDEGDAAKGACNLACVQLLGDLAKKQDSAQLIHYAANVKRELGAASGYRVREVRKAALNARQAWALIK